MAEYKMSYQELVDYVDDCIDHSPLDKQELLMSHKAELLAALTSEQEDIPLESSLVIESNTEDAITTWKRQLEHDNLLLYKDNYIRVKDMVLRLIKIGCTSGLAFTVALIEHYSNTSVISSLSAAASGATLVNDLKSIFAYVSKLDAFDFCVYLQIVNHYKKEKNFLYENLVLWFPNEKDPSCNIDQNQWDCKNKWDDQCHMFEGDRLQQALKSLLNKHVLKHEMREGTDFYTLNL